MAQGSWLMPQGSWLKVKENLALGPGAWGTQRRIPLEGDYAHRVVHRKVSNTAGIQFANYG